MTDKPMSLYINETWVQQEGRYWIAKAIAFSEIGVLVLGLLGYSEA